MHQLSTLMTINTYFYEDEGGSIVRIEADSYSQISESASSGQCVGDYYTLVVSYDYYFRGRQYGRQEREISSFEGPISGVRMHYAGNVSQIVVQHAGTETFSEFESTNSTVWGAPRIESYEKVDGSEDNCGGGACRTEFTRNSQIFHNLNYCPAITEEPPHDDCKECCAQLLPIATRIRVPAG